MSTSCELFMILNYLEKELQLDDIVYLIKEFSRQYYIWEISQLQNNEYDTYSSAIVVSETEEDARYIHPSNMYDEKGTYKITDLQKRKWMTDIDYKNWIKEIKLPWWEKIYNNDTYENNYDDSWCHPYYVKAKLIGKCTTPEFNKKCIILASYHAG